MSRNIVTEIVEFRVVPGINGEEFVKTVDLLEMNFHSLQSGFIDTELVKGKEDGQWIMIQHWKSMDEAKEAAKIMFKDPVTEGFRQAVDPSSVKMLLLEQVKTWSK